MAGPAYKTIEFPRTRPATFDSGAILKKPVARGTRSASPH
jgi:hypothetical protein